MSASVLYMSVSLDGFIAGPADGPEQGLGVGGERLHEWLGQGDPAFRPEGANAQLTDELWATGAVVTGRRTFEIAGEWNGDHHGVPIFVLTGELPGEETRNRWPAVSYVTDAETAMTEAKKIAGGKDVMVHGAKTAQRAIAAGVLDELQLHQVPVLLGQGRRLFEHIGIEPVELELTRVVDGPGVLHLRYRVLR
jgi:dihydrofolate reductase